MKKRNIIFIFCLLLSMALSFTTVAAANYSINESSAAVDTHGISPENGMGAYIDWSQKVILAKGIGAAADGTSNPILIKAQALTAAKLVAQRNLLEAIQGANIVSTTLVENNQLLTDMIGSSVKGVLRGAVEVGSRELGYGSWEVTLAMPLYPYVSKSVLSQVIKNTPQQKRPAPSSEYKKPSNEAKASYTGLVVETSGLMLNRTISPVIYDDSGRIIYGHMNIEQTQAENSGLVDYAATAEDINRVKSGTSKAGNSPFVIKALDTRDNGNNIVISRSDADHLLSLNMKNGDFLSQCKVVVQQ